MLSNEKASVTREQNERHKKILEGLLKLPENRECADCRSKGPSLGVHISKIRSATLDTWLPEQVLVMQETGNAKANSYWEAELPPNYRRPTENDRIGLENFIRAKYDAKRWLPRNKPSKSPETAGDRVSRDRQRHTTDAAHRKVDGSKTPPRESRPAAENSKASPPPEALEEPRRSSAEKTSNASARENAKTPEKPQAPQAKEKPKVDHAADLFNLLTVSAPETEAPSASDDNQWAAFQAADASTAAPEAAASSTATDPAGKIPSTAKSATSGLEDLFAASPVITAKPEPPPKDVKKDILSLFEKSHMSSPFSLHQQQMAALQQSMLAAASGMPRPPHPIPQQPLQNATPAAASKDPDSGHLHLLGGLQFPAGPLNGAVQQNGKGAMLQQPLYQGFGNQTSSAPVMSSATYPNGVHHGSRPKQPPPVVTPSSGASFDFSSLANDPFFKR